MVLGVDRGGQREDGRRVFLVAAALDERGFHRRLGEGRLERIGDDLVLAAALGVVDRHVGVADELREVGGRVGVDAHAAAEG